MEESPDTVSFIAFPPPTGNYVVADGQGGCKVTFCVPEDQFAEAIGLLRFIGKAFRVEATLEK